MPRLKGLYLIMNFGEAGFREIPLWFEGVIANGARIVQVRGKEIHPAKLTAIAREVVEIGKRYDATVIVNDHPDVAAKTGAHGVHLGASDIVVASARISLGRKGIIGVTVRDAEQAAAAFAAGADYVAVGSIFKSPTKPKAPVVGVKTLEAVKSRFPSMPVCAIGGINGENIREVLNTGVDMCAVVSAISSAPNPEKAAFSLACAFTRKLIKDVKGDIDECDFTEEMRDELDD